MLVVAMVPLGIFAVVVAADLGSVSRSTVDSANQAILEDQEALQQRSLDSRAQVLDVTLAGVTGQVRALRDQVAATIRPPGTLNGHPSPTPPVLPRLPSADGVSWLDERTPSGTSTVLVGPLPAGPAAAAAEERAAAAEAGTEQVVPAMQAPLSIGGVRSVWVADAGSDVVRITPGLDVRAAVAAHRLDPAALLGRGGSAPFSALVRHARDATASVSWEGEPAAPSDRGVGPIFTTTYATPTPGEIGVTVWMPVEGTSYRVGADVEVRQLIGDTVSAPVSDQRGSDTLLISSSGALLGGSAGVAADFGLPPDWVGRQLPLPQGDLRTQLSNVLETGSQATLRSRIGGVDEVMFTSPIHAAHWVLASSVPVAGLLPEQAGLSKGVEAGVRHILRDIVPVVVGLLLLASVLASLLARRVVGPMRALSEAAERLGGGDTQAPVPPQGSDEIGLLADSLERMRREVNASREHILAAARELEGRVTERTSELRERNEELVALNTLAGSLTRSLEPQVLLDGALDTLRAVIPVQAGRAYVINEERLEVRSSWQEVAEARAEELAGVARDALEEHDLVIRRHPDGPLLGLPLETHDGALGAIVLVATPGWQLAARSRSLVRAVADQVGLALRTAELSAEGRELAVLEERTRLAREIHDTLAQQLTAIVLQLEAAEAFVQRDQTRARSVVVAAREQARSALQEARRSVWNLRPATLERTGLAGAVAVEVDRWQRHTGIPARLRIEEIPHTLSIPPQTEVALFRILQEALSNVAKHGRARRTEVRLELDGDTLVLSVTDDGRGFERASAVRRPGSFGLVGMEERARLIGASLAVESAPGRGTTVSVRLPLGEAVVPETAPR